MTEFKKETTQDRVYRQNILNNETKKIIPITLILLLLILGIGVGIYMTAEKIGQYGIGNPYECMKCNEIGMACKEHRGFDIEKAVDEKIRQMALVYIPEEFDDDLEWNFYADNKNYNSQCDFCNQNEKECYSCEYNRLALKELAEKVYMQGEIQDKLCDTCWNKGYAQCGYCRDVLYREMRLMNGGN